MKVLFVYPNLGEVIGTSFGIGVLSSVLKENGHETDLMHLNEHVGIPFDEALILDKFRRSRPDLLAVSVVSAQFNIGVETARIIKKHHPDVPVIFGGIHVTLNPEDMIAYDCIDMIALGEGEGALVELVDRLDKNMDISDIRNLWIKKDDHVIKNPLRKYISAEDMPFWDVSIFNYQKTLELVNGWVGAMMTRGCPYSCTYCFNEAYKKRYKDETPDGNPGRYIRYGNHQRILDGLKKIVDKYDNSKTIVFGDDDIMIDPNIMDFFELYRKRINLPFIINANMKSLNEEKLSMLKSYGCDLIRTGLESGSERVREIIMKRKIKNSEIIDSISLIRKHEIDSFTFNMIGLPTETREEVIDTFRLNAEARPDVVRISTFTPFKGTELYDFCRNNSLISVENDVTSRTYYDRSSLLFDDDHLLFLEKVQKHPDCILNMHMDAPVRDAYAELNEFISSLDRKSWSNATIQEKIQTDKTLISEKLYREGTFHYSCKYMAHLAFLKGPGGRE